MGFLEESRPVPLIDGVTDQDVETQAQHLASQLAAGTFQYLVVRKRDRIYEPLSAAASCTIREGTRFAVFRMCREVTSLLESAVESQSRTTHEPSRSHS
jgi:hypothetical protein